MSRQIDSELPHLSFHRNNKMVCAADVVLTVALRVKAFVDSNVGSIEIDADGPPPIDPTCPKQKQRANELYEAIASDGMMPYTKADSMWLARFRSALHYSNEGLS